VPSGLVKKIQQGEFIDLAELTIDRLSKPTQGRIRPVVSIVEWTQCFTNYVSIRGRAQPEKVSDLPSYEHLILEAHLEYVGDGWSVYDRQFRQIAASCPSTIWTRRDDDLWNMIFKSNQCRPHCKHCFGSTYSSDQCSAAPAPLPRERFFQSPKLRICREWNFQCCTFAHCSYIHACLLCYNDPYANDSNHRWIYCWKNVDCQRPPPSPLLGAPQGLRGPQGPQVSQYPRY